MNLYDIYRRVTRSYGTLHTLLVKTKIKHIGRGSRIMPGSYVGGGDEIEIGTKTIIGRDVMLTAQYVEGVTTGKPIVKIGDNCGIGRFSHITGINKIRIGNCLLTGRNVLITDNSHGSFTKDQLTIDPRLRPLVSSGEVVIGNNVWIGEMACILPGVHIGDGCVIGAGSVVTKDIPPYSMAVGVPARVVKQI